MLGGLAIRATGENELMSRANGINTDLTKIVLLAISNAIVALSGALVAQQQSGASVTLGNGVLLIGFAALVLGEVFTPKRANILVKLLFVVLGSILYYCIVSFVIISRIMSSDSTKLLTAVIVLVALCIPKLKHLIIKRSKG